MSEDELLALAQVYKDSPGTILLYSKEDSYLFLNPLETVTINLQEDPWGTLAQRLNPSYYWAGYLTYEMGAFNDQKKLPFYPPSIPLAQFFKYEKVLKAKSKRENLLQTQNYREHDGSESYCRLIRSIQEEINQGDVYQVNLSHEINRTFQKDPFVLFKELMRLNPAPFSAYLKSGSFTIISSSPERLLQKKGPLLKTRPIKGTAPRSLSPGEDEASRLNLLNSEKDKAELLMITDLMRNDLGKVSLPGSITVDPLIQLETYANVFHLISQVNGKAHPNFKPIELLQAVFPGGSVTGCPKLSAMEAIYRYEKRARGIYTGSIGYFTPDGDFDFNIAIRTALHQDHTLSFALGGAIVADSDPEQEYKETLHKGASLFQALG